MDEDSDLVCTIARGRHRSYYIWLNLWSILLYIFGAVVVFFLVKAVLFSLDQDWLRVALISLGLIIDGVGIKWVTDRRAEALREEAESFKAMARACRSIPSGAKPQR
jgi:hypothetical protein